MKSFLKMFSVACMLGATLIFSGCGGGGSDAPGDGGTQPPAGTKVLSATQTAAVATSAAEVFRLTDATTAGYTATITDGFKYESDKIAYPIGGQKPVAAPGGVNDVTDGNVDLTWVSNAKEVTIHLTGLDLVSEQALQSSAANAIAAIYTTY